MGKVCKMILIGAFINASRRATKDAFEQQDASALQTVAIDEMVAGAVSA